MAYYNSKVIASSFDDAIVKVTEALKKEGFGVLTEIEVKATFKKKLDVDFRNYKILGACNPPNAYKAISAEENIGVLLPCNVVVQELACPAGRKEEGKIQISAVNPIESMKVIGNNSIEEIAGDISSKLNRVLENL